MKTFEDILKDMNEKGIKSSHSIKEMSFIENFIKENGIVDGKQTVSNKYVYALYCEQNRPPMARRIFGRYFKLFFKRYQTGGLFFYRLNPEPFKLPPGYSVFKGRNLKVYDVPTVKYHNVLWTPDGWIPYVEFEHGRKLLAIQEGLQKAVRIADQAALYYHGPKYPKFNRKSIKENKAILYEGLGITNDNQEKTTV